MASTSSPQFYLLVSNHSDLSISPRDMLSLYLALFLCCITVFVHHARFPAPPRGCLQPDTKPRPSINIRSTTQVLLGSCIKWLVIHPAGHMYPQRDEQGVLHSPWRRKPLPCPSISRNVSDGERERGLDKVGACMHGKTRSRSPLRRGPGSSHKRAHLMQGGKFGKCVSQRPLCLHTCEHPPPPHISLLALGGGGLSFYNLHSTRSRAHAAAAGTSHPLGTSWERERETGVDEQAVYIHGTYTNYV